MIASALKDAIRTVSDCPKIAEERDASIVMPSSFESMFVSWVALKIVPPAAFARKHPFADPIFLSVTVDAKSQNLPVMSGLDYGKQSERAILQGRTFVNCIGFRGFNRYVSATNYATIV